MAVEDFIADRARQVKESGIRRIFNLAASLQDPVDFSIGQPDFDVPPAVKQAAINAIQAGHNGYTVTQGLPALRDRIAQTIAPHYTDSPAILVTSGLSGGLLLALMATINDGDEVLYADPYFVSYPNLVQWLGGRPLPVSTYPGFQLTADALASSLTSRSKILLLNSPGNPAGMVTGAEEMQKICALAARRDLLIISDEIYCDLCYEGPAASPVEYAPERTIVLRGFGKSYGMTGWRMGYAAGPAPLINQMGNMQQYTFVCAPHMAQHGAIVALDTDISSAVDSYREKRDLVKAEFGETYEYTPPSGAFYFFLKIPPRYRSATEFVEAALHKNLLCVPGCVFSRQDTHFRISYATRDDQIRRGCQILKSMA